MKKVVIIGAGPAGLACAYRFLKNSNYKVVVLEESSVVGGLSKTVSYNGNRMDLGGHRFFTKNKEINDLWQEILPLQGKNSIDDKVLGINKNLVGNVDPEKTDKVLLVRNRVSRIYYNKKFFDYPISIKFKVFKNLGLTTSIKCGLSYLKSCFVKLDESNLENFYINRFGRKLYSIFFEGYTEKLWGRSPKEIDSSWGSQRVKGLSVKEIFKDYFNRVFHIKNKSKETSLIESFYYPKYGPGEMFEELKEKIVSLGGSVKTGYKVVKIVKEKNIITKVICNVNGKEKEIKGDIFISSMPVKDLVGGMNNVSRRIRNISNDLPYRDFLTVGVILKKINLKNETKIKTLNNIIPDCWIYVQGKEEKLGRIQVFNNWSPYLAKDINTISLGLEYFCTENDSFWNMKDEDLLKFSVNELVNMGIIDSIDAVACYHVERVKKAYPAYFDSYQYFDEVKKFLNKIENLYCIGRNGQHRYNNMDHSMECGIVCCDTILSGENDKESIWNVNTDASYHEEKNDEKIN